MEIKWEGLKELQEAISRNPQKIYTEATQFITQGLAKYKSGIINNPWRIGGSGGGSPVSNDPRYKKKYQKQLSGNLRDTHLTTIQGLRGWIGPDVTRASYAKYIFFGTRKMEARPWLDYVKAQKEPEIEDLYKKLLENISKNLAN